ncbi:hypothetical protein JOQ06_018259, partial [Pogonophryne albipinna]
SSQCSHAAEINFFTTPLGSSPPWGELSPAVIIFSLLLCRILPTAPKEPQQLHLLDPRWFTDLLTPVYQRTLSPLPSNDNQTCAPPQETYLSSLSCPLATNRTHSTRRWDLTGDSSNVPWIPLKKQLCVLCSL